MKPSVMTHSALVRFAEMVEAVMNADDLTSGERIRLIGYWAYRYDNPEAPAGLAAAIKRCQSVEFIHPTPTSVIDNITGEVVAFNLGSQ